MPTYDYQCRLCGTVTEVIHSMLDSGPTACERCGGELRRVLYPTGIIFKGSGFYRTDSRAAAKGSTDGKPADTSAPASPDSPAGSAKPDAGTGSSGKAASKPSPSEASS